MKGKERTISAIAASLTTVVIAGLIWIAGEGTRTRLRLEEQREHLASQLGVRIEDYPYPMSFPSGYLLTELVPGMSVKEVHQVVQGYSRVLRCKSYAEIYYFYTMDDETATRFLVFYDEQMLFSEIQGEDDDSRTIFTDGCREGLFEES